jgi:hypothetical protein
LAVLNGEAAPYDPSATSWVLEIFGSAWVLDIYENQGTPKNPLFKSVASVGIKCNNRTTQSFCFHTFEPTIAICTLSRTVIWKFKEQGNSPYLTSTISSLFQYRELVPRGVSIPIRQYEILKLW